MRNYIVLFVSFLALLSSCNNDDDSCEDKGEFFSSALSKDFLLNEKWFLNEVATKQGQDLKPGIAECDLDSFYIFEQNQPDLVVLNDGALICDDFGDRYGVPVYDFEIRPDTGSLVLRTRPLQFLGGFEDVSLFSDVEFLTARDSSFKLIKGCIRTIIEGEVVQLNYSLIARANDRP